MIEKTRIGALVAGLLIVSAAAFLWQQQRVQSPAYTLNEIKNAVEDKNRLRFERFVDVEGLSESIIDEVIAKSALESVRTSTSGFGALGGLIGAQAADQLKPALTQELKSALLRSVENGHLDSMFAEAKGDTAIDGRKLDLAIIAANTGSDRIEFDGIGEIVRDQDAATVGLRFHNNILDTTLVLRVRMQKNGKRWKITKPDNLSDYLDDTKSLQERHLARENAAIKQRIDSSLRIGPITRSVRSVYYNDYVYLRAKIENIGREVLDTIFLKTFDGAELVDPTAGSLIYAKPLAPGESAVAEGLFDYNQFIDSHTTLRYRAGLEARVWIMTYIKPGGQTETVGEYLSWSDYVQRRPK